MKFKKEAGIFVIIIFILQSVSLFSYTYMNSYSRNMGFGDFINGVNARSQGMGTVSITCGGIDGYLYNPASLDYTDKMTFTATFNAVPVSEAVFTAADSEYVIYLDGAEDGGGGDRAGGTRGPGRRIRTGAGRGRYREDRRRATHDRRGQGV